MIDFKKLRENLSQAQADLANAEAVVMRNGRSTATSQPGVHKTLRDFIVAAADDLSLSDGDIRNLSVSRDGISVDFERQSPESGTYDCWVDEEGKGN